MMEEDIEKPEEANDFQDREEIFSQAVRAGKRTYFFDVKATRNNDYYLTITESKKRFNKTGRYFFEKHKIFLYKEDFEKFTDALKETLAFIEKAIVESGGTIGAPAPESKPSDGNNYTADVQFEDLEEDKKSDSEESEEK